MSYLFEYDATGGIIQSRLQGRVTSEELEELYWCAAKHVALKHPRSAILDTTDVTSLEVTTETLRELASVQAAIRDGSFVCVVVASAPDIFGTARMLELLEGPSLNFHIVHTCREAFAILGVQDPKFVPIRN